MYSTLKSTEDVKKKNQKKKKATRDVKRANYCTECMRDQEHN